MLGRDNEEAAIIGLDAPDGSGRASVKHLAAEAFAPPRAEVANHPIAGHENGEVGHGKAA